MKKKVNIIILKKKFSRERDILQFILLTHTRIYIIILHTNKKWKIIITKKILSKYT